MTTSNDEIEKLKKDVEDLKQLVGFLAGALDRMSESQSIVSDTLSNLVQVQTEFTKTQAHSTKVLSNNKVDLNKIQSGLEEVLRRLPSPEDESRE